MPVAIIVAGENRERFRPAVERKVTGQGCRHFLMESVLGVAASNDRESQVWFQPRFRMGTLDHVHVMVPDRPAAATWYAEHLGFDPVDEYSSWATDVEGGPLQISSDDGRSMLALFETLEGHPAAPQMAGIAFSVDSSTFAQFSRSLTRATIDSPAGQPLKADDIVDFDLCWAYNLADPWGNVYELNCYEYDAVLSGLVEADGLTPVRYWPRQES